ncbi:MAG: exo-alpha-sialidase [Deltaproteobacteria bacterium]|nr:exo-alpha-sialidase [Deltaproteobacteria bacterium]
MKNANCKMKNENPTLSLLSLRGEAEAISKGEIPRFARNDRGGFLIIFLGIIFLASATFCFAADISFTPPLGITHPDKKVSSPSVASDKDNRIYIAWAREDADGANIYAASLIPSPLAPHPTLPLHGGGSGEGVFSKPVKVNPKEMGMSGIHANPDIAVGQNNEIYVVWSSPRKDDGSDILFSRSIDNGKTFEKPVAVNDAQSPVSRGFESIAVGKDGVIHIVWFDGRDNKLVPAGSKQGKDGTTSTYYARSLDNGKTFEKNIKLDENTCVCCRTAITVDDKGNVYASWRKVFKGDVRDMVVAHSKDNGKTFSKPVVVSEDRWSIAACPHRGPSLGTDKNGFLYIIWYTEGAEGVPSVYFAVSKDNAKTFSKRKSISETKSVFPDHPKLAVDKDGSVFFVWEETTPVYSRIFFRFYDGEKFSEPIQISDGIRKSHDASITIDKNGNILTAWSQQEVRFTKTVLKIGRMK